MKINCADCHNEFDVQVIKIMGIERPLSNLCYTCRAIKRANLEKAEREALEQEYRDRKNVWLRTSGIPEKFLKESLGTFQDRGFNSIEILNRCQEYAKEFPRVRTTGYKSAIIISQSWGIGKSHLVCGIGKAVIEKWASTNPLSPVYYATEQVILRRVRATYSQQSLENEQQVFDHLTNVPLLIVDDMGKEEISDPRFVQRVWFSIINGRYENELPILITANLNPDGIANHLGGSRGNEASFDRLYEMVDGKIWELLGNSKRREV